MSPVTFFVCDCVCLSSNLNYGSHSHFRVVPDEWVGWMMMNDDDYWENEPRFMNLSVCLIKKEPHDWSVLWLVWGVEDLEMSATIPSSLALHNSRLQTFCEELNLDQSCTLPPGTGTRAACHKWVKFIAVNGIMTIGEDFLFIQFA